MEWIEVVDSAVKIGLGAIISGLATYIVTKQTHVRELQKIAYIRRLDSLEQVSDKTEQHFATWRSLTGKLGGIYSGRHPPAPNFSEAQWKQILAKDKDLLGTKEELDHAIARLRLLSATDAAACLSAYSKSVRDFRNNLILQRQTPTKEEFDLARKEAKRCITKFHEAMSTTYLAAQSTPAIV